MKPSAPLSALSSLKAAEEGRPAVNMRVPERQIPLRKLLKSEAAPGDELEIRIIVLISKHSRAAGEQEVAKHQQREKGESAHRHGVLPQG